MGNILLLTTASGFEKKAEIEIKSILEDAHINHLFMKGNIIVTTKIPQNEATSRLVETETKYIGRITPIDKRIKISKENKSIEKIKKEILILGKLTRSDTFIIKCRRRGTHNFHSQEIKKELGTFLESETEAIVDFDNPKKTITVEIFQNIAFLGINKSENITRKEIKEFRKYPKGKRPINRSELKIKEAIKHFNITIKPEHKILDLGAAPGGWTKVLSSLAKEVVVVDPANLDSSLENTTNIVHLKCKSEDLYDKKLGKFDIITNDMNLDPSQSARIMNNLAHFLVEDGIVIMTLKFVTRNRSKHKKQAIEILEENYKDLILKKLPHNRLESTLMMRRKG
jgi:tRNA(Ser,Leu) C12 N-acetylase TAN1